MTVEDYRKKAKALGVTGYSSKTKDQLKSAIYRKKAAKKTVKKPAKKTVKKPAKKTTSTKRKTTKRK